MNKGKTETRPLNELCELLEVKSTYEFTKKFGMANSTLSQMNTGKSSRILKFMLRLAIECLQKLPAEERKKISRKMRQIDLDQ